MNPVVVEVVKKEKGAFAFGVVLTVDIIFRPVKNGRM